VTARPPQERPFVAARFHTAELPDTPQRTYRIPAEGWVEAPDELLALGEGLAEPVEYKRRIGGFLLWRAGPPVGEARYMAVAIGDASVRYTFDLHGKRGTGIGPDGRTHTRFRTWKEALRDAGEAEQ
jgi:hypothetical protein